MVVLHAVPRLLQIVNDAEDEFAVLVTASRWAREEAHARLVAWTTVDDGQTIVLDGLRGDQLRDDEQQLVRRVTRLERVDRLEDTTIVTPVRHAGVQIGAVLLRGDPSRAGLMIEVATLLAAVGAAALRGRLDARHATRGAQTMVPEIGGRSPAIVALRGAVVRAASTPFPVLIEGESGTGKELVARALHRLGARRDRRFASLNCAALTDELADTELFGHARGAFTGAVGARVGLFEEAHSGTLFLDEVGELSPRTQAKLLRAIQEREVRRVGENTSRTVDARLITATNRSLGAMVQQGRFREDLLFRLAVVKLDLPPLRERIEDLPELAHAMWPRYARETGKHALLGSDALHRLTSHGWPGNVRELQNVLAGLAVLAPTRGRVGARHVDQVLNSAGTPAYASAVSLDDARTLCERRTVAAALARHGGRRSAAARDLGLSRQGLTKALRRLHLARAEKHEGVA